MIQELLQKFETIYGPGKEPDLYFAPGRVNLIGEHTDYNGGHVFPCALSLGTYGAVRKRSDRVLRFYSMNLEWAGVTQTSLDDLVPQKTNAWTEYPKGVFWAFKQKGYPIPTGLDILIYGNIPSGAGLSSSAALEVLIGLILKDQFDLPVTLQDIALLGQYSENHYNGVNCGIMDQFSSAMGKKDCAIFLDTSTLAYRYTPIQLTEETLIITNSKVKHNLANSAYNDRRRECAVALADLQKVVDIQTLGDLSRDQFDYYQNAISDDICRKRAKHAVYENQRTIEAVAALENQDLALFGSLLNASHRSLRDDFEVSCKEIDLLVDLAWKIPGVLGSRITGGGFGGCTVSIVKKASADHFQQEISEQYQKETGIQAAFYQVNCGDGAHKITDNLY